MRRVRHWACSASVAVLAATWVQHASAADVPALPASPAPPATVESAVPVAAGPQASESPPVDALAPLPAEHPLAARQLAESQLGSPGDTADTAPPVARETALRVALLPKLAPVVGAGQRRAGFIVLGASLFAFAGAGAMALSVSGNRENDLLYCAGDPNCNDSLGLLARSRARDGALAGYLLLSGGIALAATGVVLLLTAPSKRAAVSAWWQSGCAPLLRF